MLILHTHIVEVAHDQSLQMFDLMSLTQTSSHKIEGPEADMLVDILVDSTADKFIEHMSNFPQDHEMPAAQNFLDRKRQKLSKH